MDFNQMGWADVRQVRSTVLAAAFGLITILSSLTASTNAWAENSAAEGVLATVDGHQFTQREVDEELLRNVSPNQLYDLRKRTLDKMIDQYLLEQAARKNGMSPGAYLAKNGQGDAVSDTEARQFYDQHKAQIDTQLKVNSYEQVKDRVVATLAREHEKQGREELMKKLRAGNQVRVMLAAPRVAVSSAGHPWSGGKVAPVTVVEFSDFQCPYCKAAENSVKAIRDKYGDQIKFVYMDFPLGFHPHALDAARAAHCASEQDKFWQYHDALFADQSKLAANDLKATAAKLGLNTQKFNACFDQKTADAQIHADQAQGQSLGVTGTPTFFINGRELMGAQPPDKFSEIIDDEMATAKAGQAQQVSRAN